MENHQNGRGLSPNKIHQLYNTIAAPALTYASNVWYIPPYKLAYSKNTRGSVRATKLFQSIQGKAARYITGRLKGTAYNISEVHTFIPPVDLFFCKTQLNAATCLCTLPPKHPLHPIAHKAAHHFVNRHKSPLHYLFHLTQLNPNSIETITPSHKHLTYTPSFSTKISLSKETAFTLAQRSHQLAHYKAYSDGSCFKNGVGAAAILYKNNNMIQISRFYLSTPDKHTLYEAELIGILLVLHLLTNLSCQLTRTSIIGLDNQAAICTLDNQCCKPSHYLLNHIHTAAKILHKKQDKLQNAAAFCNAWRTGHDLVART